MNVKSPTNEPVHKLPHLLLKGQDSLAAEIRQRKTRIAALLKEQEAAEKTLISLAAQARIREEANGHFHKTVEVEIAEQDPLLVIFADRYKEIGPEQEEELRKLLGKRYPEIFLRAVDVSMKKHTKGQLTPEVLREALGDKYEVFLNYFDISEFLAVNAPFMETRAQLRLTASESLNASIDQLIEQVQYKPTVK